MINSYKSKTCDLRIFDTSPMKTRSQLNLTFVPYKDFYTNLPNLTKITSSSLKGLPSYLHPTNNQTFTRPRARKVSSLIQKIIDSIDLDITPIENNVNVEPSIEPSVENNVNVENDVSIELSVEPSAEPSVDKHYDSSAYRMGNVLVFDTETFKMKSEWLCHQIAWGIYKWDVETKKLILLSNSMYHINEYFTLSKYRSYISENTIKIHQERGFNKASVVDVLKRMDEDLTKFKVETVAAYNIDHDFDVIRKLMKLTGAMSNQNHSVYPRFVNLAYNMSLYNPFRNANIKYMDLMHVATNLYIDDLIKKGIKDGSVWYCIETKQLRTTPYKGKRGIYSAEYILREYCGIRQTHFADDDVRDEAVLLEKILQEFGEDKIEYNVFYPPKLINRIEKYIIDNKLKDSIPWDSTRSTKHLPKENSNDLLSQQTNIKKFLKKSSPLT